MGQLHHCRKVFRTFWSFKWWWFSAVSFSGNTSARLASRGADSEPDRQSLSHWMILCWQVERKFEPWSICAGSSPPIWRVAEIIGTAVSSSSSLLLLVLLLALLSADASRRLEILAAIDPLFLHGYFTAGTRGNAAPMDTPLLIDGTCASYKGHSTLNQYLHHGTCDGISFVVVLLHNLVVVHAGRKPRNPQLRVLSRQHSDLSGF